MATSVLVIVSNAHAIGPRNRRTGIFLPEVAHPYAEFDAAKYQVDFASLTGDTPYLDALHLADDPQNLAFLVGKGWAAMQKARRLADVDVGRYDAIFVPGGLAPMVDMPDHPLLKTVIKDTWERGAVVGAVCHGPGGVPEREAERRVLAALREERHLVYQRGGGQLRQGRRAVRVGDGAHESGRDLPPGRAVGAEQLLDGKLVTGQNPASAKGVAEKMVQLLGSA